jgi:hypothetical protein
MHALIVTASAHQVPSLRQLFTSYITKETRISINISVGHHVVGCEWN